MTATVPPPGHRGGRVPEAKVASMFVDRWSRRAFARRALEPDLVRTLLEAARWAPSAGNSQPWLFVYADDEQSLANARPLLNDSNRRWADHAPLLLFVFSRKNNEKTGAALVNGQFDTGSAWVSLALQAHALGLVAHGMGGFDRERSYEVLGVPSDQFIVQAAIAVGYPGDTEDLPEDLQKREVPSDRKHVDEFAFRGRYQGT